jgi:GH15 family glucan-1,4-alpha-glucosidase
MFWDRFWPRKRTKKNYRIRSNNYKPLNDYAITGSMDSYVLVALDGFIDWCCLPHLDSPSIFGALLDKNKGGTFSIRPTHDQ